jgi:hypothetical protein
MIGCHVPLRKPRNFCNCQVTNVFFLTKLAVLFVILYCLLVKTVDKLQLTGQNLGRVFNFRSGHLHFATFLSFSVKLPNLHMKTQPKQLLGSLPLVIALPH